MRELAGPRELVDVVAERFGAHPWARVCVQGAVTVGAAWDAGDAVVWRSGHPWVAAPRLHVLGEPAAAGAALAAALRPDDEVVVARGTPVDPALGLGAPHHWSVRLRATPCPPQPGEDAVRWLADDDAVRALLAVANPHPAVLPAMRWPAAGAGCTTPTDSSRARRRPCSPRRGGISRRWRCTPARASGGWARR